MTSQNKIAAGINYIRMLKKMNVQAIAEELDEDVEVIKDCIAAARKHKDLADHKVKVVLVPPELQVLDEYYSGAMQVVKSVEVELQKPIIIKYATDGETEFQTLMSVVVRVKRV